MAELIQHPQTFLAIGQHLRTQQTSELIVERMARIQRLTITARDQFVEQQRVANQAIGEQGTAGQHRQQALLQARTLLDQRQIAAASDDRAKQIKQAQQAAIRLGHRSQSGQQTGHQPVQALASAWTHRAGCRRCGECPQGGISGIRIGAAQFDQRIARPGLRQRRPIHLQGICLWSRRRSWCQQVAEFLADSAPVSVQFGRQGRPARIAQAECDPIPSRLILRNAVGLAIAEHLQTVLQSAQEPIRIGQSGRHRRCQMPGFGQCRQRCQQTALAQRRLPAGPDQLQRLCQELDFTDAARTELDVIGHVAPGNLGSDHRLHLAQAFECGVIEIAAVDERPQGIQQPPAGVQVARHRPCLDPGITFPVAAFALVVVFHRRKRQCQATARSERPQAHIDPVAETLGRDLIEQLDQPLALPHETGLGRDRPDPVAVTGFRIGEHQVDIGTEVQFATAEFAQPEHHQRLRYTGGRAQRAVTFAHLGLDGGQCRADAGFG